MALCKQFENLTVIEKRDFIGSLSHCAMNDEICFEMAARVINYAQKKGVLDGVLINPPPVEEQFEITE
jgi:hypothetical protein